MSTKPTIIRTEASPEEIDAISQELANCLDAIQAPRGSAIISLVSLACQVMNPDITPHQLRDATLSTTQYICAILADTDHTTVDDATGEEVVDKSKLN